VTHAYLPRYMPIGGSLMVGCSIMGNICSHRVYAQNAVACINPTLPHAGSLQVYVYSDMLALFAGRAYDTAGLGDLDAHLTNTCCQSEGGLQEEDLVRLLSELPQVWLLWDCHCDWRFCRLCSKLTAVLMGSSALHCIYRHGCVTMVVCMLQHSVQAGSAEAGKR